MNMRLEVVTLPVGNVDRAKALFWARVAPRRRPHVGRRFSRRPIHATGLGLFDSVLVQELTHRLQGRGGVDPK